MMSNDFNDRPARDADGSEIFFRSSSDTVYDHPVFQPGDRVEFTVDYPDLPGTENIAAAGDAATVVGVNPTKEPNYSLRLDSQPDAKWPVTASGRYLAPEGSGVRGVQTTRTVLIRNTGELRRF
jgi:hypothetical protein